MSTLSLTLAVLAAGLLVLAYAATRAPRGQADLVLTGLVLLAMGGVMLRPSPVPESAPALEASQPGDAVSLSALALVWEDGSLYLVGRIQNTGDQTLRLVLLDIALLNEHGAELGRVGASYARLEDLTAGEVRELRAWIPFETAQQARVDSVLAY